MESLGKVLMLTGIALVVVGGAVWWGGGRNGGLLPGDIAFQKGGVRFYFPIITCLAVSAGVTLLAWLLRR
jgi:hypothetical protein